MQYQNGSWNGNREDYAPEERSPYDPPVIHHRSFENSPIPPAQSPAPKNKKKEKPWKAFLYSFIMVFSLIGILFLCVMMMPQLFGYFWKDFGNYAFVNGEMLRYDAENVANYKQMRAYLAEDVIYPGIYVDGLHIGGMSIGEAETALGGKVASVSNAYSLTVNVGDHQWAVNTENVPAQRNLGKVLEQAYTIGRTNTTDIQSTQRTPFHQRCETAIALRSEGINLETHPTYDREAVKKVAESITAYVTRNPIDAEIASFDYKTRTFTFTQSSPGVSLDQDALVDQICNELDKWQNGLSVTVPLVIVEPKVTTAALSQNFKMVAAFTTETTKDNNRNTNIDLACQAINGTALMPGETFSFNQATGERTASKGYKEAAAIAKGESVDQIGGGVCQASSTLFNAVARANLEIVSRSPHAWPSSYVNKGEDATVDWPNLDFKFKNNTDSPVFIIMYYKNRKTSAEIWGMSLGDGVKIELDSKVIKTLESDSQPKYVFNASLPYGTSKTTVKRRTGYVVETYKVWYKGNQEMKRELMHTSTYKAYQQVIEYNDAQYGYHYD